MRLNSYSFRRNLVPKNNSDLLAGWTVIHSCGWCSRVETLAHEELE